MESVGKTEHQTVPHPLEGRGEKGGTVQKERMLPNVKHETQPWVPW